MKLDLDLSLEDWRFIQHMITCGGYWAADNNADKDDLEKINKMLDKLHWQIKLATIKTT
jgi:hypothetical protein